MLLRLWQDSVLCCCKFNTLSFAPLTCLSVALSRTVDISLLNFWETCMGGERIKQRLSHSPAGVNSLSCDIEWMDCLRGHVCIIITVIPCRNKSALCTQNPSHHQSIVHSKLCWPSHRPRRTVYENYYSDMGLLSKPGSSLKADWVSEMKVERVLFLPLALGQYLVVGD